MTRSRVHRGMRSQLLVARYMAENGWPHAETAGSGRSGPDILGTPGLSIEVKARAELSPLAWLRQADQQPGLPLVVFRPNGVGENAGQYLTLMRLNDQLPLLRAAGYGTPS